MKDIYGENHCFNVFTNPEGDVSKWEMHSDRRQEDPPPRGCQLSPSWSTAGEIPAALTGLFTEPGSAVLTHAGREEPWAPRNPGGKPACLPDSVL